MKRLMFALIWCIVTFSFQTFVWAEDVCGNGEVSEFFFPIKDWYTHDSCHFNEICAGSSEDNLDEGGPHMGIDGNSLVRTTAGRRMGTPVLALCTGVVKKAYNSTSYGGTVIIECLSDEGCTSTIMAHMFFRLDLNLEI